MYDARLPRKNPTPNPKANELYPASLSRLHRAEEDEVDPAPTPYGWTRVGRRRYDTHRVILPVSDMWPLPT